MAGYWQGLSFKAQRKYDACLAILSKLDVQHATSGVAKDIVFQSADCELRLRDDADAATRFLQVVDRWPDADSADDSLLFAAEALIMDGKIEPANRLLDRFVKQYPNSGLGLYHQLLTARALIVRGGD